MSKYVLKEVNIAATKNLSCVCSALANVVMKIWKLMMTAD